MKLVAIDDNNVAHTLPQSSEIPTWLITNRQKRGMSLAAVAEKIGVKRQAVWSWEHKHSLPTADNLVKMMAMFIEVEPTNLETTDEPSGGFEGVEEALLG